LKQKKKKRTGFWKALANFNGKVEKLLSKVALDPWSIVFLCTGACLALSVPLGLAMSSFWLADAILTINSNAVARENATKAIEKDIECGILPERYNNVLDGRIQSLNEQLAMYTAKKSQLPKPGDVSAEFSGATNTSQPPAATSNNGLASKAPAPQN
jgi:hypothetical protein